ncbi:MAG: M14 family zinc carboxypeptidase [Thermoanaerobaculia bacterium]
MKLRTDITHRLRSCALAAVLAAAPAAASSAALPPGHTLEAAFYGSQERLNALGAEYDVWTVVREHGFAVVLVSAEERSELVAAGYRLRPAADLGAAPPELDAPLSPEFHFYDDFYPNGLERYVLDALVDLAAAHPNLTELYDLGDAWEGAHGGYGRALLALRVTNEDAAFGPIADKPVFFLFATIHAREVAVPELALRYAHTLLDGFGGEGGYGVDPVATWLVDRHVAYILVMQNPDGHVVNEQDSDAYRRKNTDDDDGCGFPGAEGVDLNRNHSFKWNCCGGSSSDPCSETYHGPGRASEPETQAFQAFFAAVVDDANGPNADDQLPGPAPDDTPGLFISLHSYSDLVLWPWAFDETNPAPNGEELEKIGRKLGWWTGFDPTGEIGYLADGATDDWTYGKFGLASFTYEVGPAFGTCAGFFPPYACLDGLAGRAFWQETRASFLYAHAIAPAPYQLAYGPDAFDAAATPDTIAPGDPVTLTGEVADRRLSPEPLVVLAGAEAFIDMPGRAGSGIPLAAVDGAFDETAEQVTGTIEDTALLEGGRHLLFVRGVNAGGAWGPLTATWLTVEGALFQDGFESGDTSAWDATAGD